MTIKEFIGDSVVYEPLGQMIFGKNERTGDQLLLNVRGWGAISSHMGYDETKAAIFHDSFGEWIADAINEKLKRENNA